MKNTRIYLSIFLLIFTGTLLKAQDDCDKCPGCQAKLTTGQQELAKQLSKAKEELESCRRKANNSVDRDEFNKIKSENNRLSSENSSLNAQLNDSRNSAGSFSAELTKLKEQLAAKTTEVASLKTDAEKQKNELDKYKAENQKLTNSISGSAKGATCINDWLNDRISKTQGKILLKSEVFNLYDRGDAASELCAITFQGNTTIIKQIKMGKDIITDPVTIECMLTRIENLFIHYQDIFYLRFNVKNKTAGKEQFAYIQENFYKTVFEQEKRSKVKEEASGVELKRLLIAKWGKPSDDGSTISIAISDSKENSDEDLIKK
jgi:DNA repair exonuclease SbcCD ATPase subunit